ncbi:hypothetical protein NA57DRAFT_77557 [Rhizodiscina lignyota]|uniref:Histone chaperone domain-containing protein n=1 Tax=Rhizodiscina lignyota TaxID=1504668 RepID=A0A9P4IAU4_9PEZI|nr:hypothetical protein NA57DRAFT_77557 [Rhizodiscina lignyota]
MSADEQYEAQNDIPRNDAPTGDTVDNSYQSRTGQSHIPVINDNAPTEDNIPSDGRADSDEYLAQDDKEDIDKDNIIDSRTRGAAKKAGTYAEPGDEEGLPGADDGTSAIRK